MALAFSAPVSLARAANLRSKFDTARKRRATLTCSTADDLIVVGAGTLGLKAAKIWREKHPEAAIMCATWTDSHHEEIVREGFSVSVASQLGDSKSPYVLFCAPPGAAGPEYGQCVAAAAKLASTRVVFTSSTGAYADAPVVTEDSPLSDAPRAQRLVRAEESVLNLDTGCVVRLAGLYTGTRGPHSFWLRRGVCSGGPGGMLNMLHYDDAADFAVAALKGDSSDKVYLASDGNPLTRMELLEVALSHPRFDHFPLPKWNEGTDHVKVIDGSASNAKLKWAPKWKTFKAFMEAEANFIYNSVPMPV